ncbi:MAG TPA: arsenosugar biosynthesis radical SAM (seleno)protein ArsS [Cyclobacteriaceae bacterium]
MHSLAKRKHELSRAKNNLAVLSDHQSIGIDAFRDKIKTIGLLPLKPTGIEVFQVNVGKMCNQTCKHCHVDAGPDRKEIMTRETMEQCLDAIRDTDIPLVDITGGAPEMNPDFRWFVASISEMCKRAIVRCNLTIVLANPRFNDLPEFFREHKVNVVSSLPYFNARRTDAQRGEGVFEKSIKALKILNEMGYGKGNPDLKLDLVYNPTGAFLPGDQSGLESEFKKRLEHRYGITFDSLFTITNIPVSRFLDYLIQSDNYESYMQELVSNFNPSAAMGVMCRNTLSVGWDGYLYDCDFNQMLEMRLDENAPQHIKDFDLGRLNHRNIQTNQHCYGCTAGSGSSCGGTTA